jgi:general secretion pathway protein I
MKQQSGMLFRLKSCWQCYFATAIIAYLRMQWQLSALETLKQETLALWVADQRTRDLDLRTTRRQRGASSQLNETFSWQLVEGKKVRLLCFRKRPG